MTPTPRFSGLGVLVTGSSRGLGRAIAERFAREGAHVGVTYRVQRDEAHRSLELIEAAGGTGVVIELDVRDPDSVRSAIGDFEREHRLEILVNNAGETRDAPFVLSTPSDWRSVLDTNLTGTYHCCRVALPAMMARRRGVIVNVASAAGLRARPGQAGYAASKAGVLALTRTLAQEAAPHGIRVNAVAAGFLSTGMGARLDRRVVERAVAQIPIGRFGTAEEVARVVAFLASDDAAYVVGECLVADGGLSL